MRDYARAISQVCDHIKPVPCLPIDSEGTADAVYELYLKAGFEGTIYRTGDHGYRSGRDQCLMKRKPKPGSGFMTERDFKTGGGQC